MTACRTLASRRTTSGQILPLTALMMVVLIGLTALAIDLSAAYLTERWERSVADAAALAGAQSLQKPNTRLLPEEPERVEARANAMQVLQSQLGGTPSGDCYSSAGCELVGTPYHVSVQTPSPSCIDCAPQRAMQVSIWQPQFGLTFGRIFGESTWTVRSTSVAGMVIAPQYGVITLRPSALRPNESDANYDDLRVTGGSKVIVKNADIATNSNAMCSGFSSGSEIRLDLDQGFDIHHYGAGPAWTESPGRCTNPPPGFQVTTLVGFPGYDIPERTGDEPIYNTKEEAMGTVATGPHHDPDYETRCDEQQALVPDSYLELKTNFRVNDADNVTAHCYRPGVYRFRVDSTTDREAILLEPGVYFLDYGARVGSTLIGGYDPGEPGVAVVLKEAKNQSGDPGQLTTNAFSSLLALNFGDRYPCAGDGCGGELAEPAIHDGSPVQTPEPDPTLLTVMVVPDPACLVESPPPDACNENDNQTLVLTGGGNIFLAGVQYAPTDNAKLTGGSGQDSDVGTFWAWTLEFNGGTNFNLRSARPQSTGVLRIDPACSPTLHAPPDCNP